MTDSLFDLPIEQPLSGIAMHAFLALAAESRPEKIPLAVARAVTHAVLADMCYLVSAPENDTITCFEGFNRVKEEIVPGLVLKTSDFVELTQSLHSNQPHWVNEPDHLNEKSQSVLKTLGIVQSAPYCLVPIQSSEQENLGGILVLSPFSGRAWTDNDQTQLLAISDSVGKILTRVLYSADLEDRVRQAEDRPELAVETVNEWIVESTGESVPAIETPAPAEEFKPVSRTSVFLQPAAELNQIYRAENDLLLYEITNLKLQIEQLASSAALNPSHQVDQTTLDAFDQIRTDLHAMISPLSAITGYHDLLASESVGTLTTMQQRFLERIRTAAEKIHHSIDQIDAKVKAGAALPENGEVIPSVSLQKVIEESFHDYQQLIHDRHLEVRMLTPENLPQIHGSYFEIQPVVNKILNSLLSVTPNQSSIQSKLALQVELDGKKSVLWKAITMAETEVLPGKELDEFSEYLQENVFSLAERLNCQLWMDSAIHTERQVNLLFAAV